jgi:hypothetical protein
MVAIHSGRSSTRRRWALPSVSGRTKRRGYHRSFLQRGLSSTVYGSIANPLLRVRKPNNKALVWRGDIRGLKKSLSYPSQGVRHPCWLPGPDGCGARLRIGEAFARVRFESLRHPLGAAGGGGSGHEALDAGRDRALHRRNPRRTLATGIGQTVIVGSFECVPRPVSARAERNQFVKAPRRRTGGVVGSLTAVCAEARASGIPTHVGTGLAMSLRP